MLPTTNDTNGLRSVQLERKRERQRGKHPPGSGGQGTRRERERGKHPSGSGGQKREREGEIKRRKKAGEQEPRGTEEPTSKQMLSWDLFLVRKLHKLTSLKFEKRTLQPKIAYFVKRNVCFFSPLAFRVGEFLLCSAGQRYDMRRSCAS